MPKKVLPLSDIQIKNAKPSSTDYKLTDGKGLYLLVTTTGGKLWRFNYRHLEKNKTLALGSYPDVSLAEARTRRDQARQLIANGVDPGDMKKQLKQEKAAAAANTFEKLARDWYGQQTDRLAERTREALLSRLERCVFPMIGDVPLGKLTAKVILENVLRPVEQRGAVELSHTIRGVISQVLRYGVAIGACERDVTVDLRGALKPVQRKHHAALDAGGTTDPAKVGALLRAIEGFDGSPVVKCALRLHPLVATRPGELRHAEWQEIDFDNATWSIPAGKMKMKNPHLVPLSPQALAILRELHKLTGQGRYLFPSIRSTAKPISDNTLNAALRRLGYNSDEIVSHGWRAVFRTLADEVLQERLDIIEAQLAHQVKDTLGRAYNRTTFLKERRELMNRWGGYLEGLKSGGQVISLRTSASGQ
jgi:integrase